MKQAELDKLMDAHELCLMTDGKEGAELFLMDTQFHNIEIINRKLDYANLDSISFQSLKVKNSSFSHSRIIWTKVINSQFEDVSFDDCTFKYFMANFSFFNKCNFIGTDIYNSEFNTGNIKSASFQNSELLENTFKDFGLHDIDYNNATIGNLSLINVSILNPNHLEKVIHRFASYIDANSLLESSQVLPPVFLRGMGIQEQLIEYLPSLAGKAIDFYSCFISYSKDQNFADRIYSDLQSKGVRCWLYTADMKTGEKLKETIYQAIKMHDKLLVVISANSENSDWVEEEVFKALDEEKKQHKNILFPIMIDNTALESEKPWIQKIKNSRHIGDFRDWDKNIEKYTKSLDRLLRDLKPAIVVTSEYV